MHGRCQIKEIPVALCSVRSVIRCKRKKIRCLEVSPNWSAFTVKVLVKCLVWSLNAGQACTGRYFLMFHQG